VVVRVGVQVEGVLISVQFVCTAAEPYRVNYPADILSWDNGASFGAFCAFGRQLIPVGSHLFRFGRHPLTLESVFSFPVRSIFPWHLQHQPDLSRHV